MQHSQAILSPSDCHSAAVGAVRVGGRLLREGEQWLIVDAFARVPLASPSLPVSYEYQLCLVGGHWNGAVIEIGRVEQVDCLLPHQTVSLGGDFARLAQAEVGQRLQTRARITRCMRRFFEARDFLEVFTPVVASEALPEPYIEVQRVGTSFLLPSPELFMKRLLVGGCARVFQLAHSFRAAESGPRHRPEFMMLEWYRAFSSWEAVLLDTEELLCALCEELHGGAELPLADGRRLDLSRPFPRVSVRDAFARFAGEPDAAALAEQNEDRYFQLLVDEVEPALERLPHPVFLCDFPRSQAALAQLSPGDPMVAERFELYAAGVELCNGYGELRDPQVQERRFRAELARMRTQSRSPVPALPDRFLSSLAEGMPPAAGNALGFDRLVALLCGYTELSPVLAFS